MLLELCYYVVIGNMLNAVLNESILLINAKMPVHVPKMRDV